LRLYGVQRLDAYISERPCHVQRNASVELRHRLLARQDHKLPESHDAVGLARTHGKTAEDSRMYVRSAKPKGALLSCVGGSSLDRRAGARSVVHAGVGGGRPAGTRTVVPCVGILHHRLARRRACNIHRLLGRVPCSGILHHRLARRRACNVHRLLGRRRPSMLHEAPMPKNATPRVVLNHMEVKMPLVFLHH
jgi:hypothetical protein